eukprot:gene4741-9415_t
MQLKNYLFHIAVLINLFASVSGWKSHLPMAHRIAKPAQLKNNKKMLLNRRGVQLDMTSVSLVDMEEDKPLSLSKPIVVTPSSLASSSTNLVKNCVGAGVFSITSKLIAISSDPGTVTNGIAIIALMSMWATYNFWIIGETCQITNSTTYGESWAKTVSKETEWIVQMVVTLSPIVSCLANTIVLTDVLQSLFLGFGFPQWLVANRNLVISLLGSVILFPICSLKDLSALRSVSVFGLFGQLLAMAIFALRIFDGSYFPGGQFFIPPTKLAAAFIAAPIDPMKYFVFASLLSYCFVTHYNAPRFYNELKHKNSERFLTLSSISFSIAGLIYITTMLLGLTLFGIHSKPFILNNFVSSDPLALIARSAFGASVLASFPLIFLSMRNWLMSVTSKKFHFISGRRPITAFLLTLICGLAVRFKDVSVVGSLSGAIFGSTMMFIFPPIMYIRALQKKAKANNTSPPLSSIVFNSFLLGLGAILGFYGTFNTILSVR